MKIPKLPRLPPMSARARRDLLSVSLLALAMVLAEPESRQKIIAMVAKVLVGIPP